MLQGITDAVAADPGVVFVSPAQPNDPENPTAYRWFITPSTSPQDEATTELVHRLRDEVLVDGEAALGTEVAVTGQVPATVDFSDLLSSRMPYFFLAVLLVSFLLMMVVFRSLLVPLKAVIMNLLSIGAAYGITVAVVQWGWLGDVTGLQPGPIETFAPMMFFAIVFGLSMDYEVFLLSRIKEEYNRTGDSHTSVANGLATTARVISAAAAIMVFVFGSFILENDRTFKLFGVGLASAIFLDATVVRMLLVPATMELLGDKNWWLPRWLDRILPTHQHRGQPRRHLRDRRRARGRPRARQRLTDVARRSWRLCPPSLPDGCASDLSWLRGCGSMAAGDLSADAGRLLRTRGLRALVDGLVAVVLPVVPARPGLHRHPGGRDRHGDAARVGGRHPHHRPAGRALRPGAPPPADGGADDRAPGWPSGWSRPSGRCWWWPRSAPSTPPSGDVSAFLPIEQALLPDTVPTARRTHVFARYSLVASLAGAFGALAAGLPGLGGGADRRCPSSTPSAASSSSTRWPAWCCSSPTGASRRARRWSCRACTGAGSAARAPIVLRLSALFSVDAFGGGFAVQSILVLWLSLRFGLSTAQSGAVFFWSGLLTASSALLAPRIAGRIGLVRTMVFTHVPASLLLISAAAHADRRPRGGVPARAVAPVADGCAGPHELRDGGGRRRGAHRGRHDHERPPQPGVGAAAPRGRLAAPAVRPSAGPSSSPACSRSPTTSPCSPCSTTSVPPRSAWRSAA